MEIQRKRKLIILTAICLVLLLCIILGSLDCCFNLSNVAVANQTKSSQIGEVLLKNYETRSDGKVFDSKQLSNLFKLLTNSKGSSLKDVADLGLRDSNYFRSVNGGQDIIIELNGLKWYAAYLSSTNDAKSDVVLTLWLADSTQLPINYQKVVWSAYGEDSNGNYPANMYGTSMVRTVTLNNGGSYATGYNNPLNDAYQQDASNPFAIFTMKDISGSLFKYVETPLNVAWQERLSAKENNLKVDGGTFEYNHANDAYSLTMTDFNAGRDYQDKTNYDAWKTDRVWLPSMAETGWKQDSAYDYIGLWKTSSAMRSNVKANEHTMLRTARGINYSDISRLRADGKDASAGSANEAAAIRPAFHLNLTQAEKDSIASLDAPSQLTGVYSGLEQTIADAEGIDEATWYDSEVYGDSSKVKVEYFTSDGALMQGSTPKDAGTYKVRYTIIDTVNYSWSGSADNTDKIRESTFVIGQKQIDFPKFYNDESTKVYDGGKNIAFRVASNYDKTALKITFNGEEIPTNCIVTVTEVGKYQLDVTLKDSKNYILKSTDTKMEFEVTKFEIELKLTDTVSGSSELNIFSGDEKNFNLEIAVGKGVHENTENPITVPVVIKASAPELSTEEVSEIINLTSSDTLRAIKISASDLVATTYKLSATTTNPNYSVKINPEASLKVSDASSGTAVRWQLYADGAPVNGKYMNAEIGETSVEFTSKLTYDAKQYEFKVTSPDGYVLDREFGINGYETVATNASNGAVGKNADSYKTKIRLEESATGVKTEYEIEWEITRGKFDLTNVKWRYDGKIPFSTNSAEMKAEIDITTMPKGLIVKRYDGLTSGSASVKKGRATVVFDYDTTDDSYANNYILPIQGDKTTYIYTASESLTDFEWSKDWEIVKMEIALEWEGKETVDGSGNKYVIQKLKEDKNVIEYEYYLWDTATNTVVGEAISEYEIEVEENKVKYYVGKAVIKSIYKDDVELKGEEYSQPFGVGIGATGVKVSLTSETMTYNGNEQGVKLKIEGALSESDFDIEYYDRGGTAPLDGAPKNAGKYRVEIKLKDGVVGYYLNGDNVSDGVAIIEYEIKPISIDGSESNWTDARKPPSLQLNKKELAGIEYEYTDSEGNKLTFSQLKSGNTYKIRAVIKDKTNFTFADGSFETEWKEFSVSANDILVDPNDPNAYPDENQPKPGEEFDFGKVGEALKQWWQVIASGASIVLIVAFLAKTASNERARRKAKKITNDKYKTYYAGAGLFGWAMTSWTAIAGTLMGAAALSLILMIVSEVRKSKAENELEASREAFEQRKEDDIKNMFMRMMGGGMGTAQMNMGAQPIGIDAIGIQGMLNDAVAALLPGIQQQLPQQASAHENDETVRHLLEKSKSDDEKIERLIKNQEQLIEKLSIMSNEKVVEKIIQPTEKIVEVPVEKIIEVPVEKIVEKEVKVEVPVEVEKIVEKEVRVEVPVEKVVEKVVEKEVKVKVSAPTKAPKEKAPRLTLDEAYEKLTKQQKKFFDGLREYAMSKDKCKEKKSTYFIVLGQSSVNPLIKLTVKKDTTVALFKMEDEYMKDIRRDAGSEGTKVKVKETEVIIDDTQAFATAKKMIDLREDQIERYVEYLKEQKAIR